MGRETERERGERVRERGERGERGERVGMRERAKEREREGGDRLRDLLNGVAATLLLKLLFSRWPRIYAHLLSC